MKLHLPLDLFLQQSRKILSYLACNFDTFHVGFHACNMFCNASLSKFTGEFASQFEDTREIACTITDKIKFSLPPGLACTSNTIKLSMKQLDKTPFTAGQFARCLALNETPASRTKEVNDIMCYHDYTSYRACMI